jgi:hypothetical protein
LFAEDLEEEQMDSYDTTMVRLRAAKDVEFARRLERKLKG